MNRTCVVCGKAFQAPPSRVAKKNGALYCSRPCQCVGQRHPRKPIAQPRAPRRASNPPGAGVDREKLLARKRRYRERHLEAERERNRQWRAKNAEYLRDENKKWRLAHPESAVEGKKRWQAEHPDWDAASKRALACNRRAKEMGATGHISRTDVTALWDRQPRCIGCGQGRGIDHIVEFWQGGQNTPGNLQNLCRACNVKKTARLRFHPDR